MGGSGGGGAGPGGGGIGGAIGAGVSIGPAVGIGSSLGGIEGGSVGGPFSTSGLGRFDSGPAFGTTPILASLGPALEAPTGSIFSDGPITSLEGFKPMGITDLVTPPSVGGALKPISEVRPAELSGGFNPAGEIVFKQEPSSNEADVLAGVESILAQAQNKPVMELKEAAIAVDWPEIVGPKKEPASEPKIIKEAAYWFTDVEPKAVKKAEVIMPQAEPLTEPLAVPNFVEYPAPRIAVSPVSQPATKAENTPVVQISNQTQTENVVSAEAVPAVSAQSAVEEQEAEEVVTEEVANQDQKEVWEEETEKLELKDVIDEEVLSNRIVEFEGAIELAGIEIKAEASEKGQQEEEREIEGEKIVSFVSSETADKRSGLVKRRGPDGSRVETIQAIRANKFRSVREAKEKTAATISEKVPVKKGREGREVGSEAVARVLKYLFVRFSPQEQQEVRVAKKTKLRVIQGQKPVQTISVIKPTAAKEARIEDHPQLAQVFQKAA